MPQASAELQDEWRHGEDGGGDDLAIQFLRAAGYVLRRDWTWRRPQPPRNPTDKELSAVRYLMDEWDFDGLRGYGSEND
jgi:hypothetical protein